MRSQHCIAIPFWAFSCFGQEQLDCLQTKCNGNWGGGPYPLSPQCWQQPRQPTQELGVWGPVIWALSWVILWSLVQTEWVGMILVDSVIMLISHYPFTGICVSCWSFNSSNWYCICRSNCVPYISVVTYRRILWMILMFHKYFSVSFCKNFISVNLFL